MIPENYKLKHSIETNEKDGGFLLIKNMADTISTHPVQRTTGLRDKKTAGHRCFKESICPVLF